MLEVLLRIVDDSRLSVFKPKYGTNMINAWAHILGTEPDAVSHLRLNAPLTLEYRLSRGNRRKSNLCHQS